jgi:alkylresorcinol/alkylpyrone synthase
MASLPVTLLALATAVPPNLLDQPTVATAARRIYAKSFARYPKLADVFANAGIERRYSVRPMEWFDAPHDWTERTQAYLDGASALFVQVAQAALDRAGVSACDVDVIVTVSSTGIATPSLEARVGAELGFKPSVTRVPVFGLGCAGVSLACRSAPDLPAPSRVRSSSWSWWSCARSPSAPTAAPRPT